MPALPQEGRVGILMASTLQDLGEAFTDAWNLAKEKGEKYHGTDDVLHMFRSSSLAENVEIHTILGVRIHEKSSRLANIRNSIANGDFDKRLLDSFLEDNLDRLNYAAFAYLAALELVQDVDESNIIDFTKAKK